MATFSKLLDSFDPDSKGKEFESFVKWFLKNDPEWSTQVDQIWLWDDYPDRWGKDKGIDLVFKHKNGEIWAVQAKCYSPEYYITKEDVDKFLSESGRKIINKRLLIGTTDRIGANAKDVLNAQEKPVTKFLFSDFDKSEIEYPDHISKLKSAKRRPPPTPDPHQLEAIDDIENGFNQSNRGQLISACGTGKTYTSVWVKERISAKTTLVLVPSLSLLSQTLREWTFAGNTPFDVLCVCSDQSVGKRKDEDEFIHSVKELPFPVTSNVQDINDFLKGRGEKVIFSTYQSSPLIAEAQNNPKIQTFDLIIADEAHQCAGKVGSEFATALDNKRIRANKRLFATATPRTYSVSLKRKASERGVDITCMDDEEVFGKVFHELRFGKAIEDGLLTDYQVVIVGVNDPMISEWIERRELVQTNSGDITDAESLACQIGLIKAINDYDLNRMISFHSRVKGAKAFASEVQRSIQIVPKEHRPSGSIVTDYVSGEMSAHDRRIKLDKLKKLAKGDRGLLSNARCLSEGIDIPTLDGVAFIDPRRSQVDIVQAVGRAIRLSDDKKVGTIVLPVFIKDGESAEASIQKSNFKPIFDVLIALKAHDNILSFELDQLRISLGKKKGLGKGSSGLSKIVFDLPETVDQTFSDSLKTYVVEKTTSSWNFWFGLLEEFVEREGHARVPVKFKTNDEFALGSWVATQRGLKNNLMEDKILKLEALEGWSWNPYDDSWDIGFSHLVQFLKRHGHSRVPQRLKTSNGFKLGQWVTLQRQNKKNKVLILDRIEKLEALEGWSWKPNEENWGKILSYLFEYVKKNGHARVPFDFTLNDGFKLGQWVNHHRNYYSKGKLTEEKIKRLESLEGWSWDPLNEKWENGLSYLIQFVKANGHAKVIAKYKTNNGYNLGSWVRKQRVYKDKLTQDQIERLESLEGWVWKVGK